MRAERRAAERILRQNDRGTFTVPSPHLYPHQWAWDSAFAAIGWAHVDLARATLELETLMAGAWPDGRIPHIRFHDLEADYFPGPAFWETERSTSISQPPNWAIAARHLLHLGAEPARIRALIGPIDASHRWFSRARDPLGWGAVAVAHPWESGLDNSPAWDPPMAAIDPTQAPAFRRVDTERVDNPAERPSDDEYRRYAVLVKAIAADGFGPGPFGVYDPMMTAMLARAEADLAWLGAALGVDTRASERSEGLRDALQTHLFEPALGRYVWVDAPTRRRLSPDLLAAYLPLMLAGEVRGEAAMRQALATRFQTAFPLPSAAPDAACFDPRCYWRGPVWVNMNWLLAERLPASLMDGTVALCAREGFREYFNPHTGEGLGATNFTWSAALVLDWLART